MLEEKEDVLAVGQHFPRRNCDLLAILAPLAELRFRDADITEATELRRRSLRIAVDAFGGQHFAAALQQLAPKTRRLRLVIMLGGELREDWIDYEAFRASAEPISSRTCSARSRRNVWTGITTSGGCSRSFCTRRRTSWEELPSRALRSAEIWT